MKEEKNYFEKLNSINVSDKTEKKNGLTYLSWAWAWGEVKKLYPEANYKIYETENGCIYWTDGKTAWVKTGVTINDIEHIEYLPIMNFKNKSILLEEITSFDVNTFAIPTGEDPDKISSDVYSQQFKSEKELLKEQIKKYPNALEIVKKHGKKLSDCSEEELKEMIKELEKGEDK